ncbi:hypothetical protein TIFTF001_006419 [Ficus carica]|uniref:Uncharacterized protein n=1 Tax=Ficus carica TaxID=3494 RepID=A0AA88A421_FICCA|nr:hypothetical protein TIFTF001_006419 [Ficus carica]
MYGDSLVGSEWLKIQEFRVGLKPSLGERVATKFLSYHTFEDAVNEAYKVEMLGEIEEKRDDSDSN